MLSQLILNGVLAGAVYALVGLGFTLVYRTVRFCQFAQRGRVDESPGVTRDRRPET